MREESHLDDMRAAIRGDFERLAKRRGAQELLHEPTAEAGHEASAEVPQPDLALEPDAEILEPHPEAVAEAEPAAEPEPEEERRRAPAPPPAPEPMPSLEVEQDDGRAEDASAEPETEEPPRRGFFARLLGL